MSSGKHKGGFTETYGGFDADGNSVLVAFGWGNREGETLIANNTGQSDKEFRQHDGRNHYGAGGGPNNNVKDRGKYSGPGA